MATPYIGEIRQWAGNFAPEGWAYCDGSLINISENETLFSLIGTTYGGDGQQTFGLPDLQGRVPVHQGTGGGSTYVLGQPGGSPQVTLTSSQLPVHNHVPATASEGGNETPAGHIWAPASANAHPYGPPGTANMNNASIGTTGGNQPHDNMIPYQAITYIIATEGVYPTQS